MTYNVSLAAMNLPRADGGLPVGHYVATMHFVYAPASGAPLDVSYDVMLDVVP